VNIHGGHAEFQKELGKAMTRPQLTLPSNGSPGLPERRDDNDKNEGVICHSRPPPYLQPAENFGKNLLVGLVCPKFVTETAEGSTRFPGYLACFISQSDVLQRR